MSLKKIIEAILFSSSDPITLSELSKVVGEKADIVKNALDELISDYNNRDSAIEILQMGDKYIMRVKPEYAEYVEKYSEREFDRATLRTLAVIAVKQPITLSRLAKIRGNKCYEHVRKLREMGFIKTERKGRSTIITTTKEFAAYFGLEEAEPKKIKEILRKYYSK